MFEIVEEKGSVEASWSNVMNLMDIHGKILGGIHTICCPYAKDCVTEADKNPTFPQRHSTLIYFADGFVHECKGTMIGSKSKEPDDRYIKAFNLQQILCLIPGMAELVLNDNFFKLGLDKKTITEVETAGRAVHYSFFVPSHARILDMSLLPGFSSFNNCIELLEEKNDTIHKIGEASDESNS